MQRYKLLLLLGLAIAVNARALGTESTIASSSTEGPSLWLERDRTEVARKADHMTTVDEQPTTAAPQNKLTSTEANTEVITTEHRSISIGHTSELKPKSVELTSALSTEAPILIISTEGPTAQKADHTSSSTTVEPQPTTAAPQTTSIESITEATTTEYHPISIGHADEYKPRPFEFDSQLSAQLLKILVTLG